MRKLGLLLVMVMASAVVMTGCNQQDAQPQESVLAPEVLGSAENSVTVVEGALGTGSLYALFCPSDWNGDLVVYAHGYTFLWDTVHLPNVDGLRDAWLGMGYGVAYSSYSEVGYAVQDGANRTRQLRGLFASNFGMPDKTFLVGHSMGGNISILLAERNPNLYAGALPLCGVVGGSRMAVNYVMSVRALFDYFYPGVLPGNAQYVPESLDANTATGLAFAAIMANPGPAFEMGGVAPVSIQWADPNELIDAILTGLFFQVGGWPDFIGRMHNHDHFDNMDVVYSGSSDDAALNAGVDRFDATKDAEAWLDRWYEPRGRLKIPVLTLHTTRDQVVQIFHEDRYADIVAAAGNAHMLVQRDVNAYGHCAFTLEQELDAFRDLVAWVESLPAAGMTPSE